MNNPSCIHATPVYYIASEQKRIAELVESSHDIEIGGDLFGVWDANGNPQIVYALGPGPKARGAYLGSTKGHSMHDIRIAHVKYIYYLYDMQPLFYTLCSVDRILRITHFRSHLLGYIRKAITYTVMHSFCIFVHIHIYQHVRTHALTWVCP